MTPLPQARKLITLQLVTRPGKAARVALFTSREGGGAVAEPERRRQPWGGAYHIGGQPAIEPLTLVRPVQHDALAAILGYASRLQRYGLAPLRVVEREVWPDGREAAHVWDSCLIVGYAPAPTDVGGTELAMERLTLQPHYYERKTREANGSWVTWIRVPETPWT